MRTKESMTKLYELAEAIDRLVLGLTPFMVLVGVFLLLIIYRQEIKDLLSTNVLNASALVALFSVSISSMVVAREYSLKVKAEKRLAENTQMESDVRLVTLFTELIKIADGRPGNCFQSEKVVEELFKREVITNEDLNKIKENDKIGAKLQIAILEPPVGIVVQDLAMRGIYDLSQRHNNMKDIAREIFKSMVEHKFKEDQAKNYLKKL